MGMFYNDDGKPKGLFGGIIDFAKSDYATGLAGSLSRGQGLGQAHMFGSGYEKSIKDEKFRKHQQTKLDAFHKEIAQDKAAQAERDSTITNALKIKKLGEEVKKRTFRGVDGKHYYEGGEAVLPGVQAQMPTQPQRRIVKGNDGFNYYGDDGSRVLPDVQAQEKPKDDKAFANITNLRKQFENGNKSFISMRDAFGRIMSTTKEPSPAGDLSLIYNFMKINDPASVVRESEFAMGAAAGNYGQRIKGMVGRITSGERLTPDQRADFISTAQKLYQSHEKTYQNRVDEFSRIAQSFDYDPSQVIIDHRGNVKAAQPENTPPKTINFEDLN